VQIAERDSGAVAVRTLVEVEVEDGDTRAEYVLTGPQSLSQIEQVSTIGGSQRIEEISPDEARRELFTIMPASAIDMLLDAWTAAIDQPAFVTSPVAEITGGYGHGCCSTGPPISLRSLKYDVKSCGASSRPARLDATGRPVSRVLSRGKSIDHMALLGVSGFVGAASNGRSGIFVRPA
jgi:hypothetical protein